MDCPKCGQKSPDFAKWCLWCGVKLTAPAAPTPTAPEPEKTKPVDVRTNRLAIAAFVLGILSFLLLPVALSPVGRAIFSVAGLGTADLAVLLGVISLVQISVSRGKLAGRGYAIIGTIIPIILLSIVISVLLSARAGHMQRDSQMRCAMNLSAIGKAMASYANDHDDLFPRTGGPDTVWHPSISDWQARYRRQAFGIDPDTGSGGQATVSSSLYLLVKYCDFPPRSLGPPESFVCPGDQKTTVFNPATYRATDRYLDQLWDFGPYPANHCSYTYHLPYGPYPLDSSCDPALPVAADRNPFIASPGAQPLSISEFDPDSTEQQQKNGNSPAHRQTGQNILFVDMSVSFESSPLSGVKDDNIYTSWNDRDKVRGTPPKLDSQPAHRLDSLLVHDPPTGD